MSHPDRCHSAAPNWKPGSQHPSHYCFCMAVTGGILLLSNSRLKTEPWGLWFVGAAAGEHWRVSHSAAEQEAAL